MRLTCKLFGHRWTINTYEKCAGFNRILVKAFCVRCGKNHEFNLNFSTLIGEYLYHQNKLESWEN